jgi:D-alanyl-lipoteichoic acid acyltransferase DltB (MBOAT superfamily)
MLIGGLWHGAAWTFVVWGGIHGTGLAIEHFRADRRQALGLSEPEDTTQRRFVEWLITFNVVCLAWVFFRSPTFDIAFTMLQRLFTAWGPAPLVTPLLLLTIGAMLASQFVPEDMMRRVQATYSRMPVVAQGLTLGGCFFVINALGPVGVAPFIYFQF